MSVNAAGTGDGNGSSGGPQGPHWLSRDGRYAVFVSFATNLVSPSPPQDDLARVYVRDIEAGTTELITRGSNGEHADGSSQYASISRDGRWVVFTSGAGNLVPGDTNFEGDTFLYDRQTQVLERISVTNGEQEQNGGSRGGAAISDDGNLVVFASNATNLTTEVDTNGVADVFLRDRGAGTTVRISTAAGTGNAANGESLDPSISGDGDVLVFWSFSTDLTGSSDPDPGLFAYHRQGPLLERLSDSSGSPPMVSGNGRYIAFRDFDGVVRRYDLQADATEAVSVDVDGTPVFGATPAISDNGRRVAFAAFEPGVVAGDDTPGAFVRDLDADVTQRGSLNDDGTTAPEASLPGISGDGLVVGFTGRAAARGFSLPPSGVEVYVRLLGTPVIFPTLDPPQPPKDGVWAWGDNGFGHLGTGDKDKRLLASEVVGLSGALQLQAGQSFSLARRSDGGVSSWGRNIFGELGDPGSGSRSLPGPVSGLASGVLDIAAGRVHGLALRSDGTVRGWGYNGYGQVGDGSTSNRSSPVPVTGLVGVVDVAAGDFHSLARLSSGVVRSWGWNIGGQLGDNSTTNRTSPVAVAGLTGTVAIAAGFAHSLALLGDGTVRAWGDGGTIGDGTTSRRLTPTPVVGLTNVVAIAAGQGHSLALRNDGTVWAWGDNSDGQLGDGTTLRRVAPVQVTGLSSIVAVYASYGQSFARRSDGTLWAWGNNINAQLGDGTVLGRPLPVQVTGLTNVTTAAAGTFHTLAAGRASPTLGVESFSIALSAGATVTSDVEGDGATPGDPVETAIMTPNAGTVSVAELPRFGASDFSIAGLAVQITAPAATSASPMVIRFRLDATVFPADWPLSTLTVARNGVVAADCSGPGAVPDPCVESRARLSDDDVEIVVRTSSASMWAVGRGVPVASADGPYSVAEGSSVVLDGAATGGVPPYTSAWLAAGKVDDPAASNARFTGEDDGVFPLTLVVRDVDGLGAIDETTVTVTNALPAVGGIQASAKKVKVNTQLKVSAEFSDPGALDIHTATWSWGDGKNNGGSVSESAGSGRVTGTHVFQKVGTYTITLTVRDDDGGAGQRTLVVQVVA